MNELTYRLPPGVEPWRYSLSADEIDRRFGNFRPLSRTPDGGDGGATPASSVVELRLYVSPNSISCAHAITAVRKLLGELPRNVVRLEIIDIEQDVAAATADRILFTPTLILRDANNRTTRLLGNLSNPALLLDVLRSAGVTTE